MRLTRSSLLRRATAAAVALSALELGLSPRGARFPSLGLDTADAEQVLLSMTGSTQMYTLGQLMSVQYSTLNPDVNIGVNPTSSQFAFDNTCTTAAHIGMSDVYIQDAQLREGTCGDMIGIPVAISATPLVYNLPGKYFNLKKSDNFTLVHPLRLTPQVVASIYMGQVTKWNDPAIAHLNPGMKLPAERIRAFNSAEPGGSGFVFNQWLALSVPKWMQTVGVSMQPAWPTNASIGQASSGSMVQAILSTPYSLGFVGFDYAISNRLQAAALRNASSVFLTPSLNGLSYAINRALQVGMPADFRRSFVTVADPHAFNPACFEFFLVHNNLTAVYTDVGIRQAIKGFLEWAISSTGGQLFIEQIEYRKIGQGTSTELAHGFIPVPDALRGAIQTQVDSIQI